MLVDDKTEVVVAAMDRLADGVTCRLPTASPLDFAYAKMHGVRRVDDRRKTEAEYMARSKGGSLNVGETLCIPSFLVDENWTRR